MLNPQDTVRVNVPRTTQDSPPQPKEENRFTNFLRNIQEAARKQREWNRQAEGINMIPAGWSELGFASASALGNVLGQGSRFLRGQSPDPSANWGSRLFGGGIRSAAPVTKGKGAGPTDLKNIAEEPAAMTFEDFMSGYQFDSTPYDNYMNFLMQQDEETMARINAMYAQLAESAEGNMQRVADVYDSARIQSGDVFGGSAQNIEDAYSSASQQAADQMARLGIEAAAPAV